jgi:predicted lipid-binding transport protein (Tim44 family)
MPWRLLVLAVFLVLVAFFIGFNLDNRADISLGFVNFEQVLVFYAMFIAYLLGVVTTIPFAIARRMGKPAKSPKQKKPSEAALPAPETASSAKPADTPAKKNLFGRAKKKKPGADSKAATPAEADASPKD